MSIGMIIAISFLTSIFIFFTIIANKEYYSKENREKRKRLKNVEYNHLIHRECDDCAGTGMDPMGSCYDCDGRGFIERI